MKKICLLFVAGLMLLGMVSCNSTSGKDYTTIVDAYTKTSVYNNDTVHGIDYTVITMTPAASVEVQTPDGETVPLNMYQNNAKSYYLSTPDSLMTTSLPTAGTYTFTVNFNDGMVANKTDVLSSDYLLPLKIDTVEYQSGGPSIYLKWEEVMNADAYQVKVYNNGQVVYGPGPFVVTAGQGTYDLTLPTSSFSQNLTGTVKVELIALKFETTAYTNIQAISAADRDVTISPIAPL